MTVTTGVGAFPPPPPIPAPGAAFAGSDDVPVSRDIKALAVLGLLACSIGAVALLGFVLRRFDLHPPTLPMATGAKLFTASVALWTVDRLGWWRRVGFRGPSRRGRLWLGWIFVLYVALALSPGLPLGDLPRLGGVLMLTLAVGLDEEVWTRGLLLESLRHRGTTFAVVVSALAFGFLHAINALAGQPLSSTALQVFVATAFGLGLGALRVRCHSIWPAIAAHAAWDFALIARSGEIGSTEGATRAAALVTVALMTPLALYGLVLARPSKVPGPDGRMRRPVAPLVLEPVPVGAAPARPAPTMAADALGRWPAPPPDVEAVRRGW